MSADKERVKVKSPICKPCNGGEIHHVRERDGAVIVYCPGSACVARPENIQKMDEKNEGGSNS